MYMNRPMPQFSPFRATNPFHPYADSWMRRPEIATRIEGFDPQFGMNYVDPRRLEELRRRQWGGRFPMG